LRKGEPSIVAQFFDETLHIAAVAIMLDLESVPIGVAVGNAVTDIGCGAGFEFPEPIGPFGAARTGDNEGGDQPRLIVDELPNAAFRGLH
jgi:hypothetical protein